MKNTTLVSIIIPHKNIPELLERCLLSIPTSNEFEIIVVDDNSDNIDKSNFPGIRRDNTKVIFSDKSITAGGARNLGLKMAKGKWLLFADADDFFHKNMAESIYKYAHTDFDVVYFGLNSVHSVTLEKAERVPRINSVITRAEKGDFDAQEYMKYQFLYPSCKLIRRSIVVENNIYFDEVPASNDVMFSMKVSTSSKNFAFNPNIIYCLTYRENSLVRTSSYENLLSRLKVSLRQYDHLKKYGKQDYTQSILPHWWKLRKVGYGKLFLTIPFMISNYKLRAFYNDINSILKNRIKRL